MHVLAISKVVKVHTRTSSLLCQLPRSPPFHDDAPARSCFQCSLRPPALGRITTMLLPERGIPLLRLFVALRPRGWKWTEAVQTGPGSVFLSKRLPGRSLSGQQSLASISACTNACDGAVPEAAAQHHPLFLLMAWAGGLAHRTLLT